MDKKKIAIIVLVFIFLGTMIFAFANPKDEELKGNSKPSEVDKDKITDDDKQDEEDKEKEGEIEKLEEENNNTNTVVNTNNGNNTDVVVDYYKLALEAVEKAEASLVQNDVDSAKDLINNVITDQKDDLLDRINDVQNIIDFDKLLKVLENKTNSSTNKNELNDARDFNTSNLVADKLNSLKDSASKTEFEERYNTVLLTLNDVTNPVINGVTEGEYTKRELEIEVVEDTEYVITLDGEAYELGTSIGEGVHVLKVVDKAFNEKVVNFTIDRTAPKLQPSYWKKTVEANKDVKEFTDLPEVKGIDELSDNVTVTLVNNTVNMAVPGEYKLQYVTEDQAGNKAYNDIFITVVDTTAPVITLNGESEITIEAGIDAYTELGAKVTDNVDATIENLQPTKINYSVNGEYVGEVDFVDIKKVGTYKVVYTYTDKAGNVGVDTTSKKHEYLIRVVNVVDTTSPVLALNGEENITVEAGLEYVDAGITATDNAEGKITESYTVYYSKDGSDGSWTGAENNEVNTKVVGSYNIWYEAKDESGNVSSIRRTVKVVDTTKPDPSVVEILTLEAFKGNTEYAKSGKTIRVYLTFKEELSSQRNGILGTYFGLFKVNGEELPLRKDSYNEETKEYNYIASYTIPEDANIEEGILPWSVEIFGDLAGNTIDPITKTVNARPGRTQIIYDNTIPGKVSTTYTPSDLTNQDVTVTIRVNEVITPVDGWTLSDDKMAISKTFSENIKGNVVVSDLAGNSEIRYYSVDNIDKESPVVDTLRVKGLKDGEGTTNFKKIKVGDTFQVILTTIEELGTLPVLVVDGKEITDVKVNKFDTYYQYIVSYKIPEDTTLIDGEQIAFVLKGYTDKAGNPGIELTNDNIKIGNGQTEVIFDKSAPTILIDRNITLHVGDNFVDDIREKIFDNVTSVENLYVGGGWGTFKDTSVAGNYHLNYKIMDEAGNYSVATRNITVIEP